VDLASLIAQQLVINPTQQKKSVSALLPEPQDNRSYADVKKIPQSQQRLILIASRYNADYFRGEWLLSYSLQWPGPPLPPEKREASPQQLENFYKEFVKSKCDNGDEKYFKLKQIDKQNMRITFNGDMWIRDAFYNAKQFYSPPLSLVYMTRKVLPIFAWTSVSLLGLNNYLSDRFKEFLKSKPNWLKHPQFAFLEKFSVDLFNYSFSFREMKFTATLKYSVVLASLAAYMLWRHKKEFSAAEMKALKRKASNMKDVKNLDKYIKRL